MDERDSLVRMLKQLVQEMQTTQQLGSGYYSCIPYARRFNKLLGQARKLFPDAGGLISTFEEIEESDPKDPGDKLKIVQGIRVEIGQLASLLESAREGGA